jgi:hypothetical protein
MWLTKRPEAGLSTISSERLQNVAVQNGHACWRQDPHSGQTCQHLAVSEQTYQRWRAQFGGMKSEEAKRIKEMAEKLRLKRPVAENEMDIAILKDANDLLGKPEAPRGESHGFARPHEVKAR